MSNEDVHQEGQNNMADQAVTKQRRKSSGPRQQRPVFALVTYTDEQGAPVQLSKDRLNIKIERDSAKIVDLLTSGEGAGSATVVRVELPQPTPRKSAEGGAASA
jgi:hypothetical protein